MDEAIIRELTMQKDNHEERITKLEASDDIRAGDIAKIKAIQERVAKCEHLHKKSETETKRIDDVTAQNTQANLLNTQAVEALHGTMLELTNSINNLTETVEKKHEPVIATYSPYVETIDNVKKWWAVNTWLFIKISGVILGVAAIVVAIKSIL